MPDLIWIIAALLTLLGAIGVWLGLRGKRLNDHPICRKCKFDLVGVYPADVASRDVQCPECGRDLNRKRAVRFGARRRRPLLAIGSALILLAGAGGLGVSIWGSATKYDWSKSKPEWLLMAELHDGAGDVNGRALTELLRRALAGSLSASTHRQLALEGLARQSADRPPEHAIASPEGRSEVWSLHWGGIIVEAIRRDLLSDGATIRFLSNAMFRELSVDPQVPADRPLRLHVSYNTDLAGYNPVPPIVQADVLLVSLDGKILARHLGAHDIRLWEHSGGFGARVELLLGDVEPGLHRLGVTLRYQFFDQGAAQPIVAWTEVEHFNVLVQPAGTSEHELVAPQEDREAMRHAASERFHSIRVTDADWSPQLRDRHNTSRFPHPVCAEVIMRCSEGDFVIQHVVLDSPIGGVVTHLGPDEFPSWDDTVTIILRPSLEIARKHPQLQGFWGEDIVIENVPVIRLSPAEVEAERAERIRALEEQFRNRKAREDQGGGGS